MKTKLHFRTIQNCKNGFLSFLILFFITASSFGQSGGIEFNVTCTGASGTIQFGPPDAMTNGYPSWSNDIALQGFSLFVQATESRWEVYGPGGGGDILYLYSEVFVNDLPSCDGGDWLSGPNIGCSATITCTGGPPEEVCDGIDNDGDGDIDEGLPVTTYYIDGDEDGYGELDAIGEDFCSDPGVGYSLTNDDCDDLEYDVYPGAPEICDGLDNNCDGQIDEGITDCIDGVIIEYCDDKQKKIVICHNGKTKCVSINAMDAHLAHGDYLGTCGGNGREGEIDVAEEVPTSYDVVSWPNPTSDSFNIKMVTPNFIDKVNISAFDMNGRLIHSNIINGNEDYQFGSQLSSGVYFIRLSQANTINVIRVIKQ